MELPGSVAAAERRHFDRSVSAAARLICREWAEPGRHSAAGWAGSAGARPSPPGQTICMAPLWSRDGVLRSLGMSEPTDPRQESIHLFSRSDESTVTYDACASLQTQNAQRKQTAASAFSGKLRRCHQMPRGAAPRSRPLRRRSTSGSELDSGEARVITPPKTATRRRRHSNTAPARTPCRAVSGLSGTAPGGPRR